MNPVDTPSFAGEPLYHDQGELFPSIGHKYPETTNSGRLHQGDNHFHYHYPSDAGQQSLRYQSSFAYRTTIGTNQGQLNREPAVAASAYHHQQTPLYVRSDSRQGVAPRKAENQHQSVFLLPYEDNLRFIWPNEWPSLMSYFLPDDANKPQDQASDSDKKPHRRAALYGLSGVGKTQLAIKLAHEYRRLRPDHSVFWIHASTADWFRQGFEKLADSCGIEIANDGSADVFTTVGAWLKNRTNRPWLMIIDNADDADMLFESRRRLAAVEECAHGSLLVTTQNKKVAERITRYGKTIHVQAMTQHQSVMLLNSFSSDAGFGSEAISSTSQIDSQNLVNHLGNLPLAVAQAAAFMKENNVSVATYLAMWRTSAENAQELLASEFEADGRNRFDPDLPNAVATTMILTLDRIYSQRPRAGKMLIQVSFYHATRISPALLLLSTEQEDSPRFVEALGDLQAFSLVVRNSKGDSYDMHNLVHRVLRTWRMTKVKNSDIRDIEMHALVCLAKAFPTCASRAQRQKADMNLPHALRFLQEAQLSSASGTVGDIDKIKIKMMAQVAEHLLYQGRTPEAKAMRNSIVELCETVFIHDSAEVIRARCELAQAMEQLRQFEQSKSICLDIVRHFEDTGKPGRAFINSLRMLSRILAEENCYEESLKYVRQAKEVCSDYLGPEHEETLVLDFTVAEVLYRYALHQTDRRLMLLEDARRMLERSLETLSKIRGPDASPTILGKQHLTDVLDALGSYEESEELSKEIILSKQHELGDHHLETFQARLNLALCLIKRGQLRNAEILILESVADAPPVICEHYLGKAKALQILASIHEKRAAYWRAKLLDVTSLVDPYVEAVRTLKSPGELKISLGEVGSASLGTAAKGKEETDVLGWKTSSPKSEAPVQGSKHMCLGANDQSAQALQSAGQSISEQELQTRETGKVLGITKIEPYRCPFADCEKTFSHLQYIKDHIRNIHTIVLEKSMLKEFEKALEYKLEVIDQLLATPGIEHPHTLQHLINTARSLLHLFLADRVKYKQEAVKAKDCLQDVLAVQTDLCGANHEDPMSTRGLLVVTLHELGHNEEAEKSARVVWRHRSQVLGKSHRETLTMQHRLALILHDQPKSLEQSITVMRECFDLSQQELGKNNIDTITRENLWRRWKEDVGFRRTDPIDLEAASASSFHMLESEKAMTKMLTHNTLKFTAPQSSWGGRGLYTHIMANQRSRVPPSFQFKREQGNLGPTTLISRGFGTKLSPLSDKTFLA